MAVPIAPGGTLTMLTGGGDVIVVLPVEPCVFVRFPVGLNTHAGHSGGGKGLLPVVIVPGGTLVRFKGTLIIPSGVDVPVLLPVVIPTGFALVTLLFTITVRSFVHVAPRQLM